METTEESFTNEISKAIAREKRVSKRNSLLTFIFLLGGLLWIYYSFKEVGNLQKQSDQLKEEIKTLSEDKRHAIEATKQIRGLAKSLGSITGERKKAVDLALDLRPSVST